MPDIEREEEAPFKITKEMQMYMDGDKAKLSWYQRNIKVPFMLLKMYFPIFLMHAKELRSRHSWYEFYIKIPLKFLRSILKHWYEHNIKEPYERKIKHPIILYFAKRAFKRNRLDTFYKWVLRLPRKLNFIIDLKTQETETLHQFIARTIEANHNQANTLIKNRKELELKLAGPLSNKEKRHLILQKKQLFKALQKASRTANDALHFFLELNYNVHYQPLHELDSQLPKETFDEALKTIASRYQIDPKAEIADVLDPILKKASVLQKATLALCIAPYTKHLTAKLLGNESTDPKSPSPQSIVLNLFSKQVPKPATFHDLKSLENQNRLSPYAVFLNEIEARIQKNSQRPKYPVPQMASKAEVRHRSHVFQDWLVTDTPQVNLTQQNQSQSQTEQTQTTQQSQLLAAQQKLDPNLKQKTESKTQVPFRILVNDQNQIIEFSYEMLDFSSLTLSHEGYLSSSSATKKMMQLWKEAQQESNQAFNDYISQKFGSEAYWTKEQIWKQVDATQEQAWQAYQQALEQDKAQHFTLDKIKDFFKNTPDKEKDHTHGYQYFVLGKDHPDLGGQGTIAALKGEWSSSYKYQKPTHLTEIQVWLQALVNATLVQHQATNPQPKPPFVLELNVDAATIMTFDDQHPSQVPPILAKYTPRPEFVDKPAFAFRVTENSANKIDPDTTHFTDYAFLDAEVLAWLSGIEQQAEQHHRASFLIQQRLMQAQKSRPDLKLELPTLETAKKTDLAYGGKTQLRYLLKNMLLERSQFGGDEIINARLRLLMQLDQKYIDCAPFIYPADKYSFLSLLNDYVFQNTWDSYWYELATPTACTRFLANPEFQALGEVLLDAQPSVLHVLFSILNYAQPLDGKRPSGTLNFINQNLPGFLNNYLYLKNLNLWQTAAGLLQEADLLDKIIQFKMERSTPSSYFSTQSAEIEDPTCVSKEAYLYDLLFSHDVTNCSKEQLESLLHSIAESDPPATEIKRVPTETLYGKTKRIDLIVSGFYGSRTLPPSMHDLRYTAQVHLKDDGQRNALYFQSPAFIWNKPFSKNTEVILNQLVYLSNTSPRVCDSEQIRFFRNTLQKLFEKYDAPSDEQLIILQGMVQLFLKYIENPMIKSVPLFWERLIEKYTPFLEKNSATGIALLTAEINSTDFKTLNTYVGEAVVQIQQARKQLPEIGMRSFALLSILGRLSEHEIEAAIELRNALDDAAHEKTFQKRDKRTPLEQQQDFAKKLNELTAALPLEKQILLHRLQFEADYEDFKVVREQYNEKAKARAIPETQATRAIEVAARALEKNASAFDFLLKHLNSNETKNKQFNAQINALEALKKACDQTKNLSASDLKEYIQQHQLALSKTQPKGKPEFATDFLAAAIRMSELQGVGVPTQSQLYIILHHLQRLQNYNPEEQSVVFYELDAGEGKTLTLQMLGLLDAYFGVQNDIQTHQRDLAKTGAAGIQELAQDFFGIQVRDLYRQAEQKPLNQTAKIHTQDASSFVDFQHETLATAHMVYIDVYDNMLQMAKRTHLKDGPRHDVRNPKQTHLSIDEVDHLLDISAKVTAHIAELEKDPKKLLMLHDFYRVLNDGMAKILSDQMLLNALEACKDSDAKRELTKNILLKEATAKNFPEVTQYINELVKTPTLFDGWINSALTVHTLLKHERNRFYTFETESINGKDVQVLYITLKDTSGKVMRDAQWSAGVHQLLSDYWLNEHTQGRDEATIPYFIPPLSNTVLHTGVELLGDAYYFITGVTATLGSPADKAQLAALFPGKKIEFIHLPPSTPNRRFDFAPLVTNEVFEDFYDAMTESLEQKEAVILRFETIEEVEAYQSYCRGRNPNCVPYMFDDKRRSESPMSENLVIRKLADGGVGVITNAGGRGTDFKNIKRLYMANAASAGTRPTIQAKRRAGRFGKPAITQVMITKEELGLLAHPREFSDKQKTKLFKPLTQGMLESTKNFQKRLNEQRLAQKRAHTQLIKIDLLKDLQQKSNAVQKKISKKSLQKISLLDTEKKHIVFASQRLQQKQAEKDKTVNSESAHKMLHNRIIDAIQTAVSPKIMAQEAQDPIHAQWYACLAEIQAYMFSNKIDEAVHTFQDFAGKYEIHTEKAVAEIARLQAMHSPRPVK